MRAEFGTRELLLKDRGLRRNYLCAVFPSDSTVVPVAAFALTKVLPAWNRYEA